MGLRIKIEQAELSKLKDAIDKKGLSVLKGVQDITSGVAEEMRSDAQDNIDRKGAVNEGILKNSIEVRSKKKNNSFLFEIGSWLNYAFYVEFGRRPGKRPPIRDIQRWVKRKGLAGRYGVKSRKRLGSKSQRDKEDLQLAFAIANSIAQNGVKARPFLFPAFAKARKKYILELKEYLRKL